MHGVGTERGVAGKVDPSIENAKTGPILERVNEEAHRVEHAPHGPDVRLLGERGPEIQVHHLWGPVHLRGFFLNVLLSILALLCVAY